MDTVLSLNTKAPPPNGAAQPSQLVRTENTSRRPLRILVVDDDRDSVLMLMMLLKEVGHVPHGCYAGRYVMGNVIDVDPDVVILDINLPDMTGWEVARIVRTQWGKIRPVLIGISGDYKDGADRMLARILGIDHYFVKPYSTADLLGLLETLRRRGRVS